MSSWYELPVEIVQAIFCHFSKPSEFSQLQLVCRNWGLIAQQYLYRNVHLEEQRVLELCTRTITASSHIGQLVKIIDFGANTSRAVAEFISPLSRHCPLVTHIFVKHALPDFYYSLRLALSQGRFQFLIDVPTSTSPFSMEKYYEIAIALQPRLTVLVLNDYTEEHATSNGIKLFKQVAGQLRNFPQLAALGIHRFTKKSIMQFDELIQDCLLLDSLSIHIYDIYDYQPDERYHIPEKDDVTVTRIIPRPHISTIKDSRFIFYSDQDIQYLIHKFPNLDQFELRTDMYSQHEIMEFGKQITIDAAVELFSYIAHIPHHRVTDLVFENFALILTQFLKNVDMPLHIHFCNEIIRTSIHSDNLELPTIHFERKGRQEIGKITIKKRFFDLTEVELEEESILPFVEFLENAGQLIKHLEVSYFPKNTTKYFRVHDIIPHCPNLEGLYLNGERVFPL